MSGSVCGVRYGVGFSCLLRRSVAWSRFSGLVAGSVVGCGVRCVVFFACRDRVYFRTYSSRSVFFSSLMLSFFKCE
jgi:hypothetical protein